MSGRNLPKEYELALKRERERERERERQEATILEQVWTLVSPKSQEKLEQ